MIINQKMVTFTEIIYMITGPSWLQAKIGLIATILAGAFLVYFGGFVHGRIILPLADLVRQQTHYHVKNIEKVSKLSNAIANSLATIFFLLYVYFGSFIVAEFLFEPILNRLRNFVLIITLILFFIVSYAINNLKLRKKFMER